MAESGSGGKRRARRSTEVSRQLARARERNNRQLVAIREREVQVDQALRDYVAATEQIEAADLSCEERVAQWEQRMRQLREEHERTVLEVRSAQCRAVLAIHTAGRTVKQVAELLELSEKSARQLIACARDQQQAGVPASTVETGTSDYREPTREYEPVARCDDERDARQ